MDDAPSFSARPEEKLLSDLLIPEAHKTHQYSGPIPRKSWNSWKLLRKIHQNLEFTTFNWPQNNSKFPARKWQLEIHSSKFQTRNFQLEISNSKFPTRHFKLEILDSKFSARNSGLEKKTSKLSKTDVKIFLGIIWPWNDLKRPQWANMSSLKLYAGINSRLSESCFYEKYVNY